MKRITYIAIVFVFAFVTAAPAFAQFGWAKRAVEVTVDKTKEGVKAIDDRVDIGKAEETSSQSSDADQAPSASRIRVKDGEQAVLRSTMSPDQVTAKIREYFRTQQIEYNVNPDTGTITTDWANDRRCGIGFNRCEDRAVIRIASEGSETLVRIQVFERKREAGLSPGPWQENARNKGELTTKFASSIDSVLSGSTNSTN